MEFPKVVFLLFFTVICGSPPLPPRGQIGLCVGSLTLSAFKNHMEPEKQVRPLAVPCPVHQHSGSGIEGEEG